MEAAEQQPGTPGPEQQQDWSMRASGTPEPAGYLTPTTAKRLPALSGHEESFQVDSFNKAMQRSHGGAGKLTALFKSKMLLARTATGSGAGSPAGAASSPNCGGAAAAGGLAGGQGAGGTLSADDMLQWSNEQIPTSLLRLTGPDNVSRAVKMFAGILRYCGDVPSGELPSQAVAVETTQKLLHQGLKRPELRDELYMQLVKQTRANPGPTSRQRAWSLFNLVAASMPPSKDFTGLISEYAHGAAQDMPEADPAKPAASATIAALKRSIKCGPRKTLPSVEEISAHMAGQRLSTIIFFLDETFEEVSYDITTCVSEALESLAATIRLTAYSSFGLYEALRPVNWKVTPEPLPEEHLLLDEHRYLADIVAELKHPRVAREGQQSRLLFKKKMFRESDDAITEPQFIALSYVQAQADYLAGNYPVVRDDAAQMAALQIHAEYGPNLDWDEPEVHTRALERFITRQVLSSRPREEWKADVGARYRALHTFSKEDVCCGFLRILRTLPYGNATFFAVRRIEDPIGLLPPRLILGINKRGVHFFRPVPKEYLHSAELRDIMQFGSSSAAVFFKMRVAGVLHIFQFETRQGEDICMALQTHINDIMVKRYNKVKATSQGGDGGAAASSGGGAATAAPGNAAYTAKMDEHLREQAVQLEAAQAAAAAAQAGESSARLEAEARAAELRDLRELMDAESAKASRLADSLAGTERALADARNELDITKAALTAAAASANEHSDRVQVEHARLTELEGLLEAKHRELEEAQGRAAAATRAAEASSSERELLERRVARLERAREAEAKELRDGFEASAAELRSQLKARNERLHAAAEQAAEAAAQLDELRAQLADARVEAAELEELRDLKADIERKEKQQAAIIDNQARRLEELDRLYRDEVVARKRAHNALQDAKGKIRVYCRVRPLLEFEAAKKQPLAISVPSELTVAHAWRDEKKPREYDFDGVYGPGAGQEAVFEDTKHLVRSALDGYNVCVFAYGQTGSGKTFTIYGSPAAPGLTPRGVAELWRCIAADAGKADYSVRLQMLELYQDTLMDLLLPEPPKGAPRPVRPLEPPRLDIKRDAKGCVTVVGATAAPVASEAALLAAIEQGLAKRHIGSTAMNHESSRSHLIISCLIEGVNLQSQAVTRGKISFVDLAGSERVKKSGSTGECLKEAQAINKSLSALGDVISALATEQPHIPYRNHKLTMLMSDSLGGNAKTLMFVNVAPGESNLDESSNSLVYATRVRTIKNNASRDEANKEVVRLRRAVEFWKEQAGLVSAESKAAADLTDIENRRCDSPSPEPGLIGCATPPGPPLSPLSAAAAAAGGSGTPSRIGAGVSRAAPAAAQLQAAAGDAAAAAGEDGAPLAGSGGGSSSSSRASSAGGSSHASQRQQ